MNIIYYVVIISRKMGSFNGQTNEYECSMALEGL